MRIRFNSIHSQLLTGFLVLIGLTLALSSILFYYYYQLEKINKIENDVESITVDAMHMMAADEQFITNDIQNVDFFKNQSNYYLRHRDSLFKHINERIISFEKESESKEIASSYSRIIQVLDMYHDQYLEVLKVYKEKGFVEYGVEGEMRDLAHQLEKSDFNREWYLTFRRLEKDYLLRKDTIYIIGFNEYFDQIYSQIKGNSRYESQIKILIEYQEKFLELAKLEELLGLHQNDGLRGVLFERKIECLDEFRVLGNKVLAISEDLNGNANLFFIISVLIAISISLIISIFLAKRFSRPIQNLSDSINNFLYKDWNADLEIEENTDVLEMQVLTKSYKKLVNQLKEQYEETKSKTEELDLKNGKLLKIGEEMDEFVKSSSNKLRSPLNTLQGLVQLIRLGKLTSNDNETVDMIESALDQIENHLTEFNEFVELRKEPVKIEDVALNKLIKHLTSERKRKSQIPVNVNLNLEEGLIVKSDLHRLNLILSHVLNNSFTYYDREIQKLNLLVESKSINGVLEIHIQDDGMGIEEDQLENIFKMFVRASNHSKGSGLGLYIAKASLKSIGGTIQLKSIVGEGTGVIISIPMVYKENA